MSTGRTGWGKLGTLALAHAGGAIGRAIVPLGRVPWRGTGKGWQGGILGGLFNRGVYCQGAGGTIEGGVQNAITCYIPIGGLWQGVFDSL